MDRTARHESRRRHWLRALLTLAVTGATVTLAATPASAVSCAYDTLGRTLTVAPTAADPTEFSVQANGQYLAIADVNCALLSEVNKVTINVASRPSIVVEFDLQNGPLGPGNTVEPDGTSEIEFSLTGMTSSTSVWVHGTSGSDVMRVGQYTDRETQTRVGQINMNAVLEGGSPDVDVTWGAAPPGSISLFGHDGNDTLSGQGTGTALAGVSPANLSLDGQFGSNTVVGGSGNDALYFSEEPDGGDLLSGGTGSDRAIALVRHSSGASLSLDGAANDGANCPGAACNGDNLGLDIEAISGSAARETIVGNSGPQTISGGGGLDTINGLGGDDQVSCAGGVVDAGGGNDSVGIFPGCGGARGGKGIDTAAMAGSGPVTVSLDDVANDGSAFITNVRADFEKLVGTPRADTLSGSDGGDTIDGREGNDNLFGLGGPDTLIPGLGADTAIGGTGNDRMSFETSPFAVYLDAQTGLTTMAQGNDAFGSVESFLGSPQSDTLLGSGNDDTIDGGAGNDILQGRGGADMLSGGDGDDSLDGGNGSDICNQGAGTGTVLNCEA